jgi:hypothetical protein
MNKWILLAVLGVSLNGLGLSLVGDAVTRKTVQPDNFNGWFWEGTFSLIVVNAGLCCLVEAGLTKLKLDLRK